MLRPAKVARRVADAKDAVSGRPRVRGTPSSMAILPFAKHPVRVKKLWKDRETLKKEEIRLHTLTRGPCYDVSEEHAQVRVDIGHHRMHHRLLVVYTVVRTMEPKT